MNRVLPLIAACLLLSACGGGGSGGSGQQPTTPGPIGETPAPAPNPTPDPQQLPTPAPEPPPPSNPPPETSAMPKSAKRGIAYDLNDPSDLAALAPGVSWWYRWSLKPASGVPSDYSSRYDMDFIPMLWNGNFNAAEVESFLEANPRIKFLLLLNEPNLTDQANMTPQQAAELWPRYEAIAASTGVQLVGPAMTWGTLPGFADPVVWLDAFYAAYRSANAGRDPRIDYLAFHWYDYGLSGQLDRLSKYGKPFWVTEFANWHSGNDGAQIDSVAKQKEQMTEMVAVCESRDDVFRYAWFTGRWADEANRHTSLLGGAGELTELGRHYLAQRYWVGSWVNPQSSQKMTSVSFKQQTLRHIVRTSVAGSTVRIKLSNAQGKQPVTVSDAHVALSIVDSSIDASTDRTVTFEGKTSVTLQPGGETYSDAVSFPVDAQADVAVSFYLPESATVAAESQAVEQWPTYIAAGNVSHSADIAVGQRTAGYHLLAGLDVQGEALRGSVAAIGGDQRWTDALAERLNEASINVGVLTTGELASADALGSANLRWVIHSASLPIDSSYEQMIASLLDTGAQMRQRQVKLLCATLPPYEGNETWSASAEQVRQRYNSFVRSSDNGCDAIIDQDGAVRDRTQPTKLLPMYDSGDHMHLNGAGQRALAEAVDLSEFLRP